MTKPAELRGQSTEDLQERLSEAESELFSLRSQQATVQMENPADSAFSTVRLRASRLFCMKERSASAAKREQRII